MLNGRYTSDQKDLEEKSESGCNIGKWKFSSTCDGMAQDMRV